MSVSKTIQCRVWEATDHKEGRLREEYDRANKYVRGETDDLYSATKQAMDRYVDDPKDGKEYPLFLRNDTFDVGRAEHTERYDYWAKIPVHDYYGGITVPVIPHEPIKDEYDVKDSKIVRKDGYFELHLSVRFEVTPQQDYHGVLAVDLGEKVYATAVLSLDGKPRFYGKDIRGLRRHYAHLRKRLQKKKLMDEVKRLGEKERRTVEQRLHEIARDVVRLACRHDAILVLGDVETGRGDTGKGKTFNRIINDWAQGKLERFIQQKAREEGIEVVEVNEAYTSKECHRCGSKDTSRPSQGRFKCHSCGLDHYNADANAANNILQRFSAQAVENGAASRTDGRDVTLPETRGSTPKSEAETPHVR